MTNCVVCQGNAGEAFLCRVDLDRLTRHIAELPSLFAELTVTVTRQGKTYRAAGRMERPAEASDPEAHIAAGLRSKDGRIALRSTSLPFDESASVLRDECWMTCVSWAKHLVETRRARDEDGNETGPQMPTNDSLLPWLASYARSFAYDEAAAEAFDEFADVHRRLERAVDNSPARTFWGRCHADLDGEECGRDLYADSHAANIVCDGWKGDGHGCGDSTPVDVAREKLRDLLGEHLAPLDAIKAVLPRLDIDMPKPGLWRSWVHRKQLQPRGRANGVALYSGAEVLALVLDEGSRRGPKRGAA